MELEVRNGCFGYSKERNILNHIDFKIQSGDILAILGPNGAGKTTLLKCIMNMHAFTEGDSFIDGVPISKMSNHELWDVVAYVPQAKATNIGYSVEEMIMLGRSNHIGAFSKPSKKDYEMVKEVMEYLDIQKLSGKKCSTLSGGELQMVLIARALVSHPKLLIFDEPESNLDFKNQLMVLNVMKELKEEGMAIIFNTHYPEHALQVANKTLVQCYGGHYMFGDSKDVINSKMLEQAFDVKAVISDVEAENETYKCIVPVSIVNKV